MLKLFFILGGTMPKWIISFFCLSLLIAFTSCTATQNVRLEKARFAMDNGDYTSAIADINQAYTVDSTDEEIILLRASAYAGRAGLDLPTLAQNMTDSDNSSNIFQVIHAAFVDTIGSTGLADLRIAVTTLTTYITDVGVTAVDNTTDIFGDLGILEAVEAFARPTILAQPTADDTVDATLITADNKAIVQTNLLDADNYLLDNAGYKTDNQLVKTVRQNYCVLTNATGASGFTLGVLRDLTVCQLADDPDSLTLAGGDLSTVATCATFDFDACDAADDSTL